MLSNKFIHSLNEKDLINYLYGLTYLYFNKPEYKEINIKKTLNKCDIFDIIKNYKGEYKESIQSDDYKLSKITILNKRKRLNVGLNGII